MDKQISSDISQNIKNLIRQVSGIEENNEKFNRIYKSIIIKIKHQDTMNFLTKKEMDRSIAGMADKFNFHGFVLQAKSLKQCYDKYITNDIPKPDLINRLKIIKLLLSLSEKPTAKFLENPAEFHVETHIEEDEIDWKAYLNEGIEPWSPNYDVTSDEDSDISEDLQTASPAKANVTDPGRPIQIESIERTAIVDIRANREELLNTIQHSWFNRKTFREFPQSAHREANVQFLWEGFLEEQAMGLVKLPEVTVITEYKVIREILWQLWTLHTSVVFELSGNNIQVKDNVTVSSIRSFSFKYFIENEFLPYIEVMDFFRDLSTSLETSTYEFIESVPTTYRCYNSSLKSIIRPCYSRLVQLEDKVRDQETTYTLLNLARDLGNILQPIMQLKKIHKEIVLDHKVNNNFVCASTLLCRLHNSLARAESKLDHDLRLTLFLESLQHYLSLIDAWFTKNDFVDYSNEFPIKKESNEVNLSQHNKSFSDVDIWKLEFDLRDGLPDECSEDGIIKIIREIVLQIGRNLHLLRLLGNFSLLNEETDSIHKQFVKKSLEQICKFFKLDPTDYLAEPSKEEQQNVTDEGIDLKYKTSLLWRDGKSSQMDNIENLVDTNDGFLMVAFQDYLVEKPKEIEPEEPLSLFEKISLICESFFPVWIFFENILNTILKEQFTISGLLVKNMLIEQYHLEKQFQFLKHLFLFQDDLIFPFYRRLFERVNSQNHNWGNGIWLTSVFRDIIVDVYPDFYEKCVVTVKGDWKYCTDSLAACSAVSLKYTVQWPLNIIITSAHMTIYNDMFNFLLKIKWALYTLTHLYFTDLEPKMTKKHKTQQPKTHRITIAKLKYLKFVLTNLLSSIQHYIFSFVYAKHLQKFDMEFEKAYDLSSILKSHSEFINDVSLMTMDIRTSEKGVPPFDTILTCVNTLKHMWTNMAFATPDRLHNCQKFYEESYQAISPILFPVFIFE